MNHERSHSGDRTSPHSKKNKIVRPQNQVKYTRQIASPPTADRFTDNHQIISFHQILWFWLQHSPWFDFSHGLFWGIVVGLTAVFSASGGVALTKIDFVEQTIVRTLNINSSLIQSEVSGLTRTVNVLVMEVKPGRDEMLEFSSVVVGETKTILLLKFQPELDTTEVISIPTDSRVKIPKLGWGTLADANRYGGTTLVSQLVGQLLDGTTIDRYIRGTPQTFEKLIASGKITIDDCKDPIENCANHSQQIVQQRIATETIRQRLNIPSYLNSFQDTLTDVSSNLDTNLSVSEMMSIANFVKDLESENIAVNLIAEYTPGKTIYREDRLSQSSFLKNK